MSQYSTGNVSASAGSTTVTGDASVNWVLSHIASGNLIRIGDDAVYYEIATVTDKNHLELTTAYASDETLVEYEILTDFTPNRDYPLVNEGDLHGADIMSRALKQIDADIQNLFDGGGSLLGVYRMAFDDGDLVGGVLTVTHNLGQQFVSVTVWDGSNELVVADAVAGSTTQCAIGLSAFAPISGTWHVVVVG